MTVEISPEAALTRVSQLGGSRVGVDVRLQMRSERADDVFVGVTCLACGSVHFVNSTTGKTASRGGERKCGDDDRDGAHRFNLTPRRTDLP
jgi:hypothetical protein